MTEPMVGENYTLAEYQEETNPDNFPVRLEIGFRTKEAKDDFLGGLCDGWGEDHCDIHWKWHEGESLLEAPLVTVDMFQWEDE